MISLFTPTNAFAMMNDEMFQKYKQQDKKGETMESVVENNAEACWRWLTSKEALEKAGRQTPLIDVMLPRDIADELDDLLMESIGDETNHIMAPGSSVWQEAYKAYLERLKGFIKTKYTTDLSEDANKLQVNQAIWRKIEWVTMKHRRRERPFPLLTKSLLPQLADALGRVQNAIAEVSVLSASSYIRHRYNDPRMPMLQSADAFLDILCLAMTFRSPDRFSLI